MNSKSDDSAQESLLRTWGLRKPERSTMDLAGTRPGCAEGLSVPHGHEMLLIPHRGSRIRLEYVQFFSGTHAVTASHPGWIPSVDVYETPLEVVVEANLAGVRPEEVIIQFVGQRLEISGLRRELGSSDERFYHTYEIERGAFARTLELPVGVDPRTAEATFHDGLLVLRVKKRDPGLVHGCYPAEFEEGLE